MSAPLLPGRPPRQRLCPGRKPCDDRGALAGIVLVLKTGIGWNQLRRMLFGCSGTTCWRRLQAWTEAGVWPRLHELLLAELRAADQLDLERCAMLPSSADLVSRNTYLSSDGLGRPRMTKRWVRISDGASRAIAQLEAAAVREGVFD